MYLQISGSCRGFQLDAGLLSGCTSNSQPFLLLQHNHIPLRGHLNGGSIGRMPIWGISKSLNVWVKDTDAQSLKKLPRWS